jgi:hypothetical protein
MITMTFEMVCWVSEEAHAVPQLITYSRTFKADQNGMADITGILNVEAFGRVNVTLQRSPSSSPEIQQMQLVLSMGTLSSEVVQAHDNVFDLWDTDLNSAVINSFEVVGPEVSLKLVGAPANVDVFLEGWVFLQ